MRLKMRHGGGVEVAERPMRAATGGLAAAAADAATPFDYMFPDLAADPEAHLPETDTAAIISSLKALGAAMIVNDPPDQANSTIPAVYTYWGQFIDHDITANTDRDSTVSDIRPENFTPKSPGFVRENLVNLRTPYLDLDSVYGGGPDADPEMYDGIKLKLGELSPVGPPFVKIPPVEDQQRDLPRGADRNPKEPLIGDLRNDENLIVAQFHLAFLRFHNGVVDWLAAHEPETSDQQRFERARQLVRWHYQWLVVNDYLRTVTAHGTVDKVIQGGAKHYQPAYEAYMPLEFSIAAYRFGHSMVRAAYDHNRNFGRGAPVPGTFATFEDLFRFTGTGGFRGLDTLPDNWPIEWDRFVDKGSPFPGRFARKIDTHLAPPLAEMVNQVAGLPPDTEQRILDLLQHLAQRNLLRGYLLSMPTGQAVAAKLGIETLSEPELQQDNSTQLNAALADGGFLEKTPLWYYILKESEVRENGQSLGDVGSRIVAETLIGLIRHDVGSYLCNDWEPSQGVKLADDEPIVTIGDFLKFAGVLV
jgi:hypothetical protein